MRSARFAILPLLISALVLAGSGCSGKKKTVKTEVLVTVDNVPIEGATVILKPVKEGEGAPANALTGSDGTARLTTLTSNDGAVPGEYIIIVTKTKPIDNTTGANPSERGKISDAMKNFNENKGKKVANSEIHANYGDEKTSKLKCTIPAPDGKIILELKKSGG